MLEQLAYDYSTVSSQISRAIWYLLAIAGAIIAHFITKTSLPTSRSNYFLNFSLIWMFTSFYTYFGSISMAHLMNIGMFYLLVIIEFCVAVLSGFFLYKFALGRSLDAYGSKNYAYYAFIPLVNLALLFTPSKINAGVGSIYHNKMSYGLSGVIIGIIIFTGSVALSAYSTVQAEKNVSAAVESGYLSTALLPITLKSIERRVKVPQLIDESTKLISVNANYNRIIYTYEVSNEINQQWNQFKLSLFVNNCADEAFVGIMKIGAEITLKYIKFNGEDIGEIKISKSLCAESSARARLVEKSLEEIKKSISLPFEVDAETVLDVVEVRGETFLYKYTLSDNISQLNEATESALIKSNCTVFDIEIKNGANVVHKYFNRRNFLVAEFNITRDKCVQVR